MRSTVAAVVILTVVIAAIGPTIAAKEIANDPGQTCWVHEKKYPDPSPNCTPGSTNDQVVNQSTIAHTICVGRWTDDQRPTFNTTSKGKRLMRVYGLKEPRGSYELDHLVPLELGGANDDRNLWPEAYEPKPGAREKDRIETWLKLQVCPPREALSLVDAQIAVRECWMPLWQHVYGSRKQQPWNSATSADAGVAGVDCSWLSNYTSSGT